MTEHLVFAMTFLVLAISACAPYHGPPCASCVGPYDLTLTSHRAALGLGE